MEAGLAARMRRRRSTRWRRYETKRSLIFAKHLKFLFLILTGDVKSSYYDDGHGKRSFGPFCVGYVRRRISNNSHKKNVLVQILVNLKSFIMR